MEMALLIPVMIGWAIAVISPGPATMAIMGTALSQGRIPALAVVAGIVTGSLFWGTMAAMGISAMLLAHHQLLAVLKVAGALYLLWLAFKAAKRAWFGVDLSAPQSQSTSPSLKRAYAKGALIHITNPKAVFFWASLFAVALPAGAGLSGILTLLIACLCISVVSMSLYALVFSTRRAVAIYARLQRVFDGLFAGLFGAAAGGILMARV